MIAIIPPEFSVNATRDPTLLESLIAVIFFILVIYLIRQARHENS